MSTSKIKYSLTSLYQQSLLTQTDDQGVANADSIAALLAGKSDNDKHLEHLSRLAQTPNAALLYRVLQDADDSIHALSNKRFSTQDNVSVMPRHKEQQPRLRQWPESIAAGIAVTFLACGLFWGMQPNSQVNMHHMTIGTQSHASVSSQHHDTDIISKMSYEDSQQNTSSLRQQQNDAIFNSAFDG